MTATLDTTRAATRAARRRPRGFSLLEVLVALGIFSIAMLGLVPLFATASWGVQGSRELTTATTLARTYVDKLRNTPFGNIGPCLGAGATCTPPAIVGNDEVAANRPYVVTWTVTDVSGGAYPFGAPPAANIKRITIAVVCPTCRKQNLNVQMTTLVSQRS
jgi:prepilin-type N-terminal cleavage/methylation domain-containing protein